MNWLSDLKPCIIVLHAYVQTDCEEQKTLKEMIIIHYYKMELEPFVRLFLHVS